MMMMIDVTSGIGMEGSEKVYNRVLFLFLFFILFDYLSLYFRVCIYVFAFWNSHWWLVLEHMFFRGRWRD